MQPDCIRRAPSRQTFERTNWKGASTEIARPPYKTHVSCPDCRIRPIIYRDHNRIIHIRVLGEDLYFPQGSVTPLIKCGIPVALHQGGLVEEESVARTNPETDTLEISHFTFDFYVPCEIMEQLWLGEIDSTPLCCRRCYRRFLDASDLRSGDNRENEQVSRAEGPD